MQYKNKFGWLLLGVALFLKGCSVPLMEDEDEEMAKHAHEVDKEISGAGTGKGKPEWMMSKGEGIYKLGKPYKVNGVWYFPKEDYKYDEIGIASWYGPGFHTKTTANGELFDMNLVSAAHKTLPLPSVVRVTNIENGRSLLIRVNDRGPFVNDRIIDLSRKAAELLGFLSTGTAKVRVELMPEESMTVASLAQNKDYLSKRSHKEDDQKKTAVGFVKMEDESQSMKEAMIRPQAGELLIPEGFSAVGEVGDEGLSHVANQLQDSHTVPVTHPVHPKDLQKPRQDNTSPTKAAPEPEIVRSQDPSMAGMGKAYVQAGAFGNLDNAKRVAVKLSHVGEAKIHPSDANGRTIYRVRFGPYDDAGHAKQVQDSIMNSGHSDVSVVVE